MKTLHNFRDLFGQNTIDGRKIRAGLIFRSSDLDKLNKPDSDMIRSLNIRTIIDLRSPKEQNRYRKTLPEIRRLNLPLSFDEPTRKRLSPYLTKRNSENIIMDICNSVYIEMADAFRPLLGKLFDTLLNEDLCPVLIHCRAGKDRTGVVCAIIQMALGVKTDDIIFDYLKTNNSLLPRLRPAFTFMKYFSLGLFPVKNLEIASTAHERYIHTFISRVNNEYGGIEKYLTSAGVLSGNIAELKSIYLEEYS